MCTTALHMLAIVVLISCCLMIRNEFISVYGCVFGSVCVKFTIFSYSFERLNMNIHTET